ncbi:hypothetical protein PTKIN_Ptkin10aG0056600 [Pterospermum kingtungense]
MKKNLIFANISSHDNNFCITFIYGHPKVEKRYKVWDCLIKFSTSLNENDDWLVVGDFNQFLRDIEKFSFKNNKIKGTELFRNYLNRCQLEEIPPKGKFFAWTNSRDETNNIWERLDRVLPTLYGLTNMTMLHLPTSQLLTQSMEQ